MKIKLNGKSNIYFFIDKEDYSIISQYRWYLKKWKNKEYVITPIITTRHHQLRMHKLLIHCDKPYEIDHINGNGLDNRRKNLRIVTHTQNMMNSKKRKDVSSKYKGVFLHKNPKDRPWRAYIRVAGKLTNLGYYFSQEKAAAVYNEKARDFFGNFACLNNVPERS